MIHMSLNLLMCVTLVQIFRIPIPSLLNIFNIGRDIDGDAHEL